MRDLNRRSLLIVAFVCAFAALRVVAAHAGPGAPAPGKTDQTSGQTKGRALTIDRIYGAPSLNGRLTQGITWSPDGKQIAYLKEIPGAKPKQRRTELRVMDARSGKEQILISADKLESALPAEKENSSQATGLGRHAAAEYQWSPDGKAILFQGNHALAWFDLKSQTAKALVSGKAAIADPKISPDGKWVSFVRDHNLWLVAWRMGKSARLPRAGAKRFERVSWIGFIRKSWS